MIRKEYFSPQMQVVELNTKISLLTMSTPETLDLEVNDPTETIGGDQALSPIFRDMGLPMVPDMF